MASSWTEQATLAAVEGLLSSVENQACTGGRVQAVFVGLALGN